MAGAVNIGIVADAAEQPVGDTGCAAGARGDFDGGIRVDAHPNDLGGPTHNLGEVGGVVEFHLGSEAEPVAEGAREHAGSGGGADQGEGGEFEGDGGSAGSLANDDVDAEVLHGHVEHFFGRAGHAVDFIDEQDVAFHEVGEHGGKVAGAFEGGPGGHAEAGAHFVGDNHGHGGFTESGRPGEEHMVGGDVAVFRPSENQVELVAHFGLANEFGEAAGPEGGFDVGFGVEGVGVDGPPTGGGRVGGGCAASGPGGSGQVEFGFFYVCHGCAPLWFGGGSLLLAEEVQAGA